MQDSDVILELIEPDSSLLVTFMLDLNKLWLEAIQNLFIGRNEPRNSRGNNLDRAAFQSLRVTAQQLRTTAGGLPQNG
jgi:hypothetical protein